MPEPGPPAEHDDALGRVVAALDGLGHDLDGVAVADLLWLASQSVRSVQAADAADRHEPRTGEAEEHSEPPAAPDRPQLPVHPPAVEGDGEAEAAGTAREVVVPRASALPRARQIATALRPLARPWPTGRRTRLDVEATVADYARGGELVPAFAPAPERWFDLTAVVDRSPTMRAWDDTVTELLRVLARSGVFRTMRVTEIDTGGDGPPAPGARLLTRTPGSRSLVLVISDCVPGRAGEQHLWDQVHQWASTVPTLLVNPLPQEKWRRAGLDLPAVRVTAPSAPGARNSRLRFTRPAVLDALPHVERPPVPHDWLPVPVVGLSPRVIQRWARTVMRGDPTGCQAVLVPAPGVFPRPPVPPVDGVRAVESFVHRASDPALSLAVLCSSFARLSPALLHLVRQEVVPQATTADVAEVLTGGLMSVVDGSDGGAGPVLAFRPGVRERLSRRLGVRDEHRTRESVSRYIATHPVAGEGFRALVSDPGGEHDIAADSTPFASVAAGFGGVPTQPPPPPFPAVAHAGPERTHQPYFFLSYAHTPRYGAAGRDPDMWVERLFRDLCSHVMAMTDLPAGAPAGFMDREIRSGEGWSERLGEVLANCRVFVPLFSPRYFASEMCGKEWYAFAQRAIYHQAKSNRPAEAIVPALWVPIPPEQLPGPAERLQFNHRAFGDRYVTDGLYGLIKLRIFAEEYDTAVYELAKRIVSVADATRLSPGSPVDYRHAPSAFGKASSGPRSMHLMVAAPTRHDLPAGRAPEYYGRESLDWNPYYPNSARPLAQVAQDLVRSLDYQPTLSSFDQVTLPSPGQRPTRPEMLIIDRWALADDARCARLAEFDARAQPWTALVVPWNRDDPQSRLSEAELAERLERTMPYHMSPANHRSTRAAARGVPSMEAFGQILPSVVEVSAQGYLGSAEVFPPGAAPAVRPPQIHHQEGDVRGPVPYPSGPRTESTEPEGRSE
ncbi:TIR-like protein FxsC [Streptomyces sp. NPDC048057]|uniref:TIR-like protein FxsC n=1 Tax=Streptomyces sp. NPDC048057 TaxID=3155628 RepID=UPI0033F4B6C5